MSEQPDTSASQKRQPSLLIKSLLGVLSILILMLFLLLFTQPGSAFIWRQLTHFLPALSGELAGGAALTGWRIKNFKWENPDFSFEAGILAFDWQPEKLIFQTLPVTLFEVQQATLRMTPTDASGLKTSEKTTSPPLTIPVDVWVQQVNIRNLTVISDAVEITLGSLKGSAQLLDNEIFIAKTHADNLQVLHKPASGQNKQKHKLVDIDLPIPVELQKLVLTNSGYQQGEFTERLDRLELSFDWQSTQINNLQLIINQARADIQASGHVQLSDNYPLELELTGTLHEDFNRPELAAIKGEQFSLQARGNLQKLQLQLTTQGYINASLVGDVSALTAQFNLQATWPGLQWPLQATDHSMAAGRLELTGDLDNYRLALETAVRYQNQPASKLTLQSTGSLKGLNIQHLIISPADSSNKPIQFTGQVNWQQGIDWQGKLLISQLQPQYWLPAVTGVLNGEVSIGFSLRNERWQLKLSTPGITGMLHNKALQASGRVDLVSSAQGSLRGEVDGLNVSLGENSASINGKIGEQLALQATVAANALGVLSGNLQGSFQATAKLGGTHAAPELSFELQSPSFYYQDFSVHDLKASGEFTRSAMFAGTANININEMHHGKLALNNISLHLSGDEKNHQIRLQSQGRPISANVLIDGQWSAPSGLWQGKLASAQITSPVDNWTLAQPLMFRVSAQELALSNQCWRSSPAQLCIDALTVSAMEGDVRFELTDFNLTNMAPLFPGNLQWQAALFGSGEIQWRDQRPTVHLKVHTSPGTLTDHSETLATPFSYQALAAVVDIANDHLQARLDLQSAQLGDAHIDLVVDNLSTTQALQGQIAIPAMQLDFLQPLLPELKNVHGTLSADARMGGTLAMPLLFGTVKLSQGEVVAELDKVAIKNLNAELRVQGSKGELSGSMAWGEGALKLSGQLDWQQLPLSGVIMAQGQNVSVRLPGILQLKASPDLTLTLGATDSLSGKILIPWARVKIKQLPKQAIASSADVAIIYPANHQRVAPAGSTLPVKVEIVLGNNITIDAYGLKSRLGGQLLLDQQPNKSLVANGAIELINGRYHQFGQDLLIKGGRIVFSGPLSAPYLSVNAIRNPETVESDVTVGINVSGPPTKPIFSIYSDPAMTQEEQWSYLLRGRPLDGSDGSAVEAMLLGFGVSQFGGVVSTIGEKIGFSDVSVDTQGSGDNTLVTLGGNLSPKLRLQYGTGIFNTISEVKVRYELMPRLYIQAISGVARAIDLFYQFRIDTKNKK